MWKLYIEYLKQWAEDHSGEECEGMSPACYDEWTDNGFYSDVDEDDVTPAEVRAGGID